MVGLVVVASIQVPSADAAARFWSDSGVVVTASSGTKIDLQVVADATGGAYVGWLDSRPGLSSSRPTAYLSHIRDDGSLAFGWPVNGLQVSESVGSLAFFHMLPDGQGGAALFWYDEGVTPEKMFFERVFMHRILDSGERHPAFPVGGLQLAPFDTRGLSDVLPNDDGCFFVVGGWVGPEGSGSQGGILLTKVDALGGTAAGWPVEGVLLCDEPGTQSRSTLLSDGQGGVIVLWRDLRSGNDARLYGARVSGAGVIDPSWPAEGKELADLSNPGPGFAAAADSGGFVVVMPTRQVIAFDLNGEPRSGWPPPQFTRNVSPEGPIDSGHSLIPSDRGTYLYWARIHRVFGTMYEVKQMLTLLSATGASATPWPDTGLVLTRAIDTDPLGVAVIRPSPAGLYLVVDAKDENGDQYDRGGLMNPDLTWAPGWPDGGREVSRSLGGGPNTIGSDGSLLHCFTFDEPGPTRRIRLFKMGVDGPVPTLASVAVAEVAGDVARVEWEVVDPPSSPLQVERSRDGVAWDVAGSPTWTAGDRVQFEDHGIAPGERRAYRLSWSEAGQERRAGLVWLERPARARLVLESARHVVGAERLDLLLSTESPDPIEVQVLDLQGRLRARRSSERSTLSQRLLSIPTEAWGAGLYFVRVTQSTATIRSRVTVLR